MSLGRGKIAHPIGHFLDFGDAPDGDTRRGELIGLLVPASGERFVLGKSVQSRTSKTSTDDVRVTGLWLADELPIH